MSPGTDLHTRTVCVINQVHNTCGQRSGAETCKANASLDPTPYIRTNIYNLYTTLQAS